MVTIGIDPHKQTHTGVAADGMGTELAQRTVPARRRTYRASLEARGPRPEAAETRALAR